MLSTFFVWTTIFLQSSVETFFKEFLTSFFTSMILKGVFCLATSVLTKAQISLIGFSSKCPTGSIKFVSSSTLNWLNYIINPTPLCCYDFLCCFVAPLLILWTELYRGDFFYCYFGASWTSASNWLTNLPIKELGYELNKEQFFDAIRIRYNWESLGFHRHMDVGVDSMYLMPFRARKEASSPCATTRFVIWHQLHWQKYVQTWEESQELSNSMVNS